VMKAKGGYDYRFWTKKNLKRTANHLKKAAKVAAPIVERGIAEGPAGAAKAAADMALGTGVSGAQRAKLTKKIHKHLIGMRKRKRGGRVAPMPG